MSYAIDKILGRTEQDENIPVQDDMRYYAPAQQDAPSFTDYKMTHNYNGNIDVAPRQFGQGNPYPVEDIRQDVRQPFDGRQQSVAYPPRGDFRPDGGYAPQAMQQPTPQMMQQPMPQTMQQPMPQELPRQNFAQRDYYQPQAYNGQYHMQFYGFAAQDDIARKTEFENKLASVNNYSRLPEKEPERKDNQNKPKMRKKLNAKGAIILALYLVVVAVVVTLIGVNAGKINSGKAVVPASEVTSTVQTY